MLNVQVQIQLGSERYDRHAIALRVRRGQLPVLDRAEIELPAAITLRAGLGDPAVVQLDGGEGSETVLRGTITGLTRTLHGVRVVVHGGALALASYRPALTLERVSVGSAIKRLCSDAAVSVSSIDDGPELSLYAADGRATALEEVARLAQLMSVHAVFDHDNSLGATQQDNGELALRYGRELLSLEATSLAPDANTRDVIGEGAAAPSSPQGRLVIADFLAGSGSPPGPGVRRRAEPLLRTPDDTRAAASGWQARVDDAAAPLRLRSWLLPKLAPRMRVELHDLPSHFGVTECRVRQVVHEVSARGAHSAIWAAAVSSGGLGGLL